MTMFDKVAALLSQPTITVPEASKLLGISRLHAYRCARNGDLPTFRIGRKILVPTAPLAEMLRRRAA